MADDTTDRTPPPDAARLRAWLTERVADLGGIEPAEVDPRDTWESYGMASADAVGLSGELEEWLQRPLPPTLVYEHPTIDALVAYLTAPAADPEPARTPTALPSPAAARHPAPAGAGPEADPVCVVGLGCRFPGGAHGPDRYWDLLRGGGHAAVEVPRDRWDADAYFDPDPDRPGAVYTRHGGFLDDIAGFDAGLFGISPGEALRMDPQQRLVLEVAWEALEHAGIAVDGLRGSRTGMFLGMMDTGQYSQLQLDQDGRACLDDPNFGIGAAPSVAAGRLSYLLDLRGPALSVDTACSSSLVGVHLAAQALRRGECDLALAAGVSALAHPDGMVQAYRMRMLAADGRCKTFDESADGFLMGEGCGAVVLERLSSARANGHRVLAVLRGSAVNQDGRSNGLTAPNKQAQTAVVRAALAAAGTAPDDVDYVEAHGSGTRLGDSLEIEGLAEAFGPRPADRHPLVVGAVKTNLGHLLGAAGMAGLIKAVLVLRHGEVPRNLHLDRPIAAVKDAAATLVLPEDPVPLPGDGRPRVAGVSSFGWSGTNAHAVLEQAPPEDRGSGAGEQGPHLLTLSAASEPALAAAAGRLADHLGGRTDCGAPALGDVAHTLRTGRSALDHRRSLVVRDTDDARGALADLAGQAEHGVGVRARAAAPVVFMFPGVGDQYPGMGRGLYERFAAFRAAVDECAEILREPLGADVRDLLDPEGGTSPEGEVAPSGGLDLRALMGRGQAEGPVSPLHRTEVAHPAVFVTEYALARLWMSLGVRPTALIGYSLGEYVAACVSGVFTLEDALRLVAERARLIDATEPGAMLAVAAPEERVRSMLPPELSVAAVNGPAMTVVSGASEAVAEFEASLNGVARQRVRTTHAFHCDLLAPVAERVAEVVRGVPRSEPRIPFAANLTGDWITAEEARDPAYWAAHTRSTVRFAEGLATVGADTPPVLLEAGPGQTLSGLAMQVLRGGASAVASMRPEHQPDDDTEVLLGAAGRLWEQGVDLDTRELGPEGRLVPLPGYPFEHTRFWPAAPNSADRSRPVPSRSQVRRGGKLPDLADWCHAPVWEQAPAPRPPLPADPEVWLLFADADGVCAELAAWLADSGAGTPVLVEPRGEAAADTRSGRHAGARTAEEPLSIDPASPEAYVELLGEVVRRHGPVRRIVHAWSARSQGSGRAAVPGAAAAGPHSLLFLAQALGRALGGEPVELVALTANALAVTGGDGGHPERATALGVCRSIDLEYPSVRARVVDIDLDEPWAAREAAGRLGRELAQSEAAEVTAYRGRRRWIRGWRAAPLPAAEPREVWRDEGGYLVTGGLGGLGLALAGHLARTLRARLTLVGRTALPDRELWTGLLAADDTDPELRRRIEGLLDLEAAGAEVLPVAADIADPEEARSVVAAARERFGTVHGVVHAAGVPGEGLVQAKTADRFDRVLRPKVAGTLALAEALAEDPPDFIALYSSATAVLGGLGESDYCAANAFLGAYAQAAPAGTRVVAVDWGPWRWDSWQAAALADRPDALARVEELRERYGITFDEGHDLLTRILAADAPQVLVIPQDMEAAAAQWAGLAELPGQSAAPAQRYPRPRLRTPFVAPSTPTEERIAALWQERLGIDGVGVDDSFVDLGGNSLVGLAIVAAIEKETGVRLSAAALLEAPTVRGLAGLVDGDRPGGPGGAEAVEPDADRGRIRRERMLRRRGREGGR
ncbi:acyl transferase domain-containing protein/acyl carrier protein [Nocardiopsis mwathae]|uniref:Acyl transferase domain-containing protein/acyl carrier protein n=1 Tax=Nocardiopsis mwathae TaxID=1472723 RepID=A0A7W9YIN6_9ACTN|nr:type I polyketide synthase [Nocardiopsis mwathae]MBB6171866.1 acyl transferase domain-containing protein/acyl carrier protein [Nocardiopsis mwathae]